MLTKVIRFFQHIYTSSQTRGGGGYRTWQFSKELGEAIAVELDRWALYKAPSELPSNPEGREKEYPVMFSYYPLSDGKLVGFSRGVYIGKDRHSRIPRMGNYFTHTLVTEKEKDFIIWELFDKVSWKENRLSDDEDSFGTNIDIEPIEISFQSDYENYINKAHEFIYSNGNVNREKILTQILDLLVSGKVVSELHDKKNILIEDKAEYLPIWMNIITFLFPPHLAKQIYFSSYHYNPTQCSEQIHIVGTIKENDIDTETAKVKFHFLVVDNTDLRILPVNYYTKGILKIVKDKDNNRYLKILNSINQKKENYNNFSTDLNIPFKLYGFLDEIEDFNSKISLKDLKLKIDLFKNDRDEILNHTKNFKDSLYFDYIKDSNLTTQNYEKFFTNEFLNNEEFALKYRNGFISFGYDLFKKNNQQDTFYDFLSKIILGNKIDVQDSFLKTVFDEFCQDGRNFSKNRLPILKKLRDIAPFLYDKTIKHPVAEWYKDLESIKTIKSGNIEFLLLTIQSLLVDIDEKLLKFHQPIVSKFEFINYISDELKDLEWTNKDSLLKNQEAIVWIDLYINSNGFNGHPLVQKLRIKEALASIEVLVDNKRNLFDKLDTSQKNHISVLLKDSEVIVDFFQSEKLEVDKFELVKIKNELKGLFNNEQAYSKRNAFLNTFKNYRSKNLIHLDLLNYFLDELLGKENINENYKEAYNILADIDRYLESKDLNKSYKELWENKSLIDLLLKKSLEHSKNTRLNPDEQKMIREFVEKVEKKKGLVNNSSTPLYLEDMRQSIEPKTNAIKALRVKTDLWYTFIKKFEKIEQNDKKLATWINPEVDNFINLPNWNWEDWLKLFDLLKTQAIKDYHILIHDYLKSKQSIIKNSILEELLIAVIVNEENFLYSSLKEYYGNNFEDTNIDYISVMLVKQFKGEKSELIITNFIRDFAHKDQKESFIKQFQLFFRKTSKRIGH